MDLVGTLLMVDKPLASNAATPHPCDLLPGTSTSTGHQCCHPTHSSYLPGPSFHSLSLCVFLDRAASLQLATSEDTGSVL